MLGKAVSSSGLLEYLADDIVRGNCHYDYLHNETSFDLPD